MGERQKKKESKLTFGESLEFDHFSFFFLGGRSPLGRRFEDDAAFGPTHFRRRSAFNRHFNL